MFWIRVAVTVLGLSALLNAQSLPAGTALPVGLNSTLNSKSAKAGERIEGKLMQELRLSSGVQVKSGSHLTGHVISVGHAASGFHLTVQFDQLQNEHQVIPITVSLRALADSQNVFQAGVPAGPASDSEASDEWVTKQVGGQYVFRGRGTIESDQGQVGTWSGSGTWGRLAPAGNCPASDNNNEPQALWIFSTTACGAYGFEGLQVSHAGRTSPVGQFTLESAKDIEVRGGSGLLLVVVAK